MKQKQALQVVVASPGDVLAEREALQAVLEELNGGIAADRNLVLQLRRWETDAYPGFYPWGPQGLIDQILKIEDCDLLIGIFWKLFGTPTKDARSGTEHEILCAYAAWQQTRRPQIMVYFNQKPHNPRSKEEIEQWGRVLDFRRRFPKEGLAWEYKGKPQFEWLVRNHLTRFIRDQYPPHQPAQVGAEQDAPGGGSDELTKEYLDNLAKRVSTVYIFGEEEVRALDKVFVELSIVEDYKRPTVHAEFQRVMDAEMRPRRRAFARAEDELARRALTESGGRARRPVKPDESLRRHVNEVTGTEFFPGLCGAVGELTRRRTPATRSLSRRARTRSRSGSKA